MKQRLSGMYKIKENLFADDSLNVNKYSDCRCNIYFTGNISIRGIKNDGKIIVEEYIDRKQEITKSIIGQYLLLIVDKKQKEVYVFQDISTSPITLYYLTKDNNVYFSSSLKHLLIESKVERCLDDSNVAEFLTMGFICGPGTLLKGIFKIDFFHALVVTENGVSQIPVNYSKKDYKIEDACLRWQEVLKASIDESLDTINRYCMALSSGYDSNYIANYVNKKGRLIDAICIGGQKGRNEISIVEKIIPYYKNIRLHSFSTNEKTLQFLPDIVWRLEGAVYEIGIFLQYELAKNVSKMGYDYLLCGECADQVLNEYFSLMDIRSSQDVLDKNLLYKTKFAHTDAFLMVLKKNGIMENSFGVSSIYPFLNIDVIKIANCLKSVNGIDKRFHKAICRQELPAEIIQYISKLPGATCGQSLFGSIHEIKRFYREIEKSRLFRQYSSIVEKNSFKTPFKYRLKTIIKKILHHNSKDVNNKPLIESEEPKIRRYLFYAYLNVFERLFISHEYDSRMNEDGFDVLLSDLR